ncbi:hypothetical protein G7Z17_g4781 [Cylindrodendrum hubeiense]|uniref:Cytochrome b5 heme-binding domain-containing protein n=1 Tax=Cylindrodendrum hubeiense TaxID=595255 RepID=A0A9P5HIF8_9HYPO|nr:hypothetical protein G7Z17_g4781 [Cylindrodendrum hubeiense]
MSKLFTLEDVAKQSTEKGGLIIVDKVVYDITDYMSKHPGGDDILIEVLGQDASEGFHEVGHSAEAMEELKGLKVGELDPTPLVATKDLSQKASVSVAQLSVIAESMIYHSGRIARGQGKLQNPAHTRISGVLRRTPGSRGNALMQSARSSPAQSSKFVRDVAARIAETCMRDPKPILMPRIGMGR